MLLHMLRLLHKSGIYCLLFSTEPQADSRPPGQPQQLYSGGALSCAKSAAGRRFRLSRRDSSAREKHEPLRKDTTPAGGRPARACFPASSGVVSPPRDATCRTHNSPPHGQHRGISAGHAQLWPPQHRRGTPRSPVDVPTVDQRLIDESSRRRRLPPKQSRTTPKRQNRVGNRTNFLNVL